MIDISVMTTISLEVTNFLGVTTLKTSFISGLTIFSCLEMWYLDNCAFGFLSAYRSCILSCLAGFPVSLQRNLFVSKGANVKNLYTKSAEGTCDKFNFIKDAGIRNICCRSICISNTSAKKAGASTSAVKYKEMNWQSFWVLKVKLFNIGQKIELRTCWLFLRLFWMLSRLRFIAVSFEIRGGEFEIRVKNNWGWYRVSESYLISSCFLPCRYYNPTATSLVTLLKAWVTLLMQSTS